MRRCEGEDPAEREQQRAFAALAAAPGAPAPHLNAPPGGGATAGGSGVTIKLEVGAEETLAQLRDRTDPGSARAPAPGPRATFVHIKVEDSTSGEDTDGGLEDTGCRGEEEEVEEGEEGVEDEQEEEEGGEGEGEGEEGEEVHGDRVGRVKRKRAQDTAVVAISAPLHQLAASLRLPPPPPQLVDVKWVEGHGERCTHSNRKPGGAVWRCASAAVPGHATCAHHGARRKAENAKARQKPTGVPLPAPAGDDEGRVVGSGGGGGGGGRRFTSKFRGVSAERSTGRWCAKYSTYSGESTNLGTFDREEDAARARDRMLVWCHLHGVVLDRGGKGGVHTPDSIKAALNFVFDDYEGEVKLRGILTEDEMVQTLRHEGRAQPCSGKHKRAKGGAVVLSAGAGGGGGGGGEGGGGSDGGGGLGGGNMDGDGDVVGSGDGGGNT